MRIFLIGIIISVPILFLAQAQELPPAQAPEQVRAGSEKLSDLLAFTEYFY